MSEKPRGRKRNIVEGNVTQIKKQDEGLGLDRVGEGVSFVSKLFGFFRKPRSRKER